jgi:hypothetical protein
MAKGENKSKSQWVLVRKEKGVLVPHAPHDDAMFERMQEDVVYRCQFARPRSGARHRLYRVILRIVVENTHLFATEDALHKTLLVSCGVVEPVITIEGEIIMYPSSTAFDAMKEEEFKAYFDAAMELITTRIIPGMDLEDLLREARGQSNWEDKKEAA